MLTSGTKGGDGCGWWQPPVADRFADRLRPFCLADWCDVLSGILPELSIFEPWSELELVCPKSDRG
jgi:hypothetical protein